MPTTYPFPLPVNSSHHSLYHRFLLGAPREALAPMPKPFCTGRMAAVLPQLSSDLTLPKWQKLYHGSFPWSKGHAPEAYELRNLAPHRPLPATFGRPARRFAAYDFVQLADPSVSVLALLGGDPRVLQTFVKLAQSFSADLEKSVRIEAGGIAPAAPTGRALIGHFVEPNNRWLMPCLHVHARMLNFTSLAAAPFELRTIDAAELGRAGRSARSRWLGAQAYLLRSLGYSVDANVDPAVGLIVGGVDQRLLAAVDAPRLAVLKILERLLGQETWRGLAEPRSPGAQPVLAAMADHLEASVHESVRFFRPQKLSLPIDGPWRQSVTLHLQKHCPVEYLRLRHEARSAQGLSPLDEAMGQPGPIPAPGADVCHAHTASIEAFDALDQHPLDPDLGPRFQHSDELRRPHLWLAQAYNEAYGQVTSEIISQRRPWIDGPRQRILRQWEHLPEDVPLDALRRELRSLDAAVERNGRQLEEENRGPARPAVIRAPSRLLGEFIAAAPRPGRALAVEEPSRGRSR